MVDTKAYVVKSLQKSEYVIGKDKRYGCCKSKYILYICTYLGPILDGKCLINKVNTAFQLWLYDMMYICYNCGFFYV